MPGPTHDALAERHRALTGFLVSHREIWRPRPFVERTLPWESSYPDVVRFLDALPPLTPGVRPDLTRAPEPLRTWAAEAAALSALPDLPRQPFAIDVRAARGLPGRKRAQIEALTGTLLGRAPGTKRPSEVLDWCAGKGHLGRTLSAALDLPLRAVEWDATLCAAGVELAARRSVRATFHTLDARSPEAAGSVSPEQLAVALHACGDLHAALLRAAAVSPPAALAVAPCCYNRADPERDLLLSRASRQSGLVPTLDDLDLIHRTPVVAGAADVQRLEQALAWRLGFDLFQRERSGVDEYRSMPPFPQAWLALTFAEFGERFAGLSRRSGALAQPDAGFPAFESLGRARLDHALRRDVVRALFSRPLEVWLLLDRALFLAEAGFEVELGAFCTYESTPRNGLLLARARA